MISLDKSAHSVLHTNPRRRHIGRYGVDLGRQSKRAKHAPGDTRERGVTDEIDADRGVVDVPESVDESSAEARLQPAKTGAEVERHTIRGDIGSECRFEA
jgi:hypothetical protein